MSIEGKPDGGKPAFVSLKEGMVVTNRTYEQYLQHFQLPEDELRSKRILDVGSGFSNFSKEGNERLKESGTMIVPLDPTYAFLTQSKSMREYEKKLGPANLSTKKIGEDSESWDDRFKAVKDTPFKVAGSHQQLPFVKGSFDLVLAHNSILQFKDREVTRRALHEITEVLADNGEIRIIPSNLLWDHKTGSFFMSTFEAPTPELLEETRSLNLSKAPDRIVFDIFKELEDQGYSIYTKASPKARISAGVARMMRFMGADAPIYSFIVRKDTTAPTVSDPTYEFYKLDFSKSPDGFHIPSQDVLNKEEKAAWRQKDAEIQRAKELEEQRKEEEEERKEKIATEVDNTKMPDELKSDALVKMRELEYSFTDRMRALSRARNEGKKFTAEEQREWSARNATLGIVRNLFEEASHLAGTKATRSAMEFGSVRKIEDTETLAKIAAIYRDVRQKLENISA